MEISEEAFQVANARGEETQRAYPSAIKVAVSKTGNSLSISFDSGDTLEIPVAAVPGFAGVHAAQLRNVTISPNGLGIFFPDIDVDLYVPALLREFSQGRA
jgi:hypothetical protein